MIGPKKLGPHGRKQHDRPPGLAIADDCGLALRFWMERDHSLEERSLRVGDVLNRLPRHRIGQEPDEVARMPRLEGDANLAVGLEPADPWPVAGAWIDDYKRALACIHLHAIGRHHADESIIHRPREPAPIHDKLVAELEYMGRGFGSMFLIALTALAQDIPEQ